MRVLQEGNVTDSTTTTATDAGTAPEGTTPPAGTEPVVTPPAGTTTDLPDWAKDPAAAAKMVADLRAENARDRTAAKTAAAAEAQQAILKALGLAPDDKPVDPAEAARTIQAKDSTIRDLQIRSALSDALAEAKAKPLARAAILGDGLLADLDPAAADFAATVSARVADYVGRNPELSATPRGPATSTTNLPGGNGTGNARTYTAAQLNDHAFYLANKADIDKAATEGRILG